MLLSQAADLARSLDDVSFVARMPDPVLIGSDICARLEQGQSFDTPERGMSLAPFTSRRSIPRDPTLETSMDGLAPLSAGGAIAEATPPSGIAKLGDPELHYVTKSARNPFRQMITIGRSANNDIVLDDKSVSKVHGYIVKTDFRYWIHDQPSTNGTFLDGSRVPTTGMPLSDGAKLSFGPRLVFSFYTARGFHRLITGR
ncbi:MAG TPA: FHA domain-containing protein [Planctomycetota bacterium]|nr:FHA domain-containing protein [Planctomycetota bacterium]